MKKGNLVLIITVIGTLCSISGADSYRLTDTESSAVDKIDQSEDVRSSIIDLDENILRTKRSPRRPPPTWKLNYLKFLKKERLPSKIGFYKSWKPTPFVPIRPIRPTPPPPESVEESDGDDSDTTGGPEESTGSPANAGAPPETTVAP